MSCSDNSGTLLLARSEWRKELSDQPTSLREPFLSVQTLPAEVLHLVFNHLDLASVSKARRACPVFAKVGLDHLGHEAVLIYHREAFQKLVQLANDPILSKHVRSLFYQGDQFGSDVDFAKWDHFRDDPDPQHRNVRHSPDCDTSLPYGQCCEPSRKAWYPRNFVHVRKSVPSKVQVDEAWASFLRTREDQAVMDSSGYDLECLAALFKGCRSLKDVSLLFRQSSKRYLKIREKLYAPAMMHSSGDILTTTDGAVRQVEALASAIRAAGAELDSLTLLDMPDSILAFGSPAWDNLLFMLRPLRRLRLSISRHSKDIAGSYYAKWELVNSYLAAGRFPDILEAMNNLRVLKLAMPGYAREAADDLHPVVDLRHIFRDVTMPNLAELGLTYFKTSNATLVGLLLRHRGTLQRLYLSDLLLMDSDWPQAFAGIAGKFTHLRKLSLRGDFITLDEHGAANVWLDAGDLYDIDDGRWDKLLPKMAVEKFICEGGQVPDPDELYMRGHKMEAEEARSVDHSQQERVYVPPASATSDDDRDLEYATDEFDEVGDGRADRLGDHPNFFEYQLRS